MNLFLIVVGAILVALGVIFIYDARPLTKKFFGASDQNEATSMLKIFGFIFLVLGCILLLFYL